MLKVQYRPGDAFALKTRMLESRAAQKSGRIVTALPEAQGAIRYRVRMDGENFDRTIGHDDIDPDASICGDALQQGATPPEARTSWINQSAIRTRK